ncbi:HAMP domain-containing protein, partial [Pengzhenrongella frigida]
MSASTATNPTVRRGRLVADRSIRTKILAVIGLLAVVAVATGAMAVVSMQAIAADSKTLEHAQTEVQIPLNLAHQNQLKARMIAAQIAAVPADATADWLADQAENDAEVDANIAAYEAAAPEVYEGWAEFVDGWAAWKAARDSDLTPAALTGDQAEYARVLAEVTEPLKDTFLDNLELVEAQVTEYSTVIATQAAAEATTAVRTLVISLGIALVVVLALGYVTAQAIRRAVEKVRVSLEAMATGDLTVPAEVESRDEVGRMAQALGAAQLALRATLVGVGETASTIAAAAEEMSAANTQVAAGSEETSARAGVVSAAAEEVSRNVQTVAAGAEEMGASIREIAQNANEA